MNQGADNPHGLTRHEEELQIATRSVEAGTVRAHTQITSEQVSVPTTRQIEHFDNVDRVAPNDHDSGQVETLEDGSISIPILEEQLVITKRLVVRERVVLQKRIELEHQNVEAELRSEHISIETEPSPDSHGPATHKTRARPDNLGGRNGEDDRPA
jgi:uncharacterized protein (TIGR02271 family)